MGPLMKDYGFDMTGAIDLLILVMVSSGVFGFIYEVLFYRIDLGYFVKRGSTYGPWVPIYFFGGALFTLLVYRLKANPIAVFFSCVVVSGLLELVTGWILFEVFHTRLWDYNVEIWNWGNIGGYVCARSVMVFGAAGLLLIYMIIPLLAKPVTWINRSLMHPVCLILLGLCAADVILFALSGRKPGWRL